MNQGFSLKFEGRNLETFGWETNWGKANFLLTKPTKEPLTLWLMVSKGLQSFGDCNGVVTLVGFAYLVLDLLTIGKVSKEAKEA